MKANRQPSRWQRRWVIAGNAFLAVLFTAMIVGALALTALALTQPNLAP